MCVQNFISKLRKQRPDNNFWRNCCWRVQFLRARIISVFVVFNGSAFRKCSHSWIFWTFLKSLKLRKIRFSTFSYKDPLICLRFHGGFKIIKSQLKRILYSFKTANSMNIRHIFLWNVENFDFNEMWEIIIYFTSPIKVSFSWKCSVSWNFRLQTTFQI